MQEEELLYIQNYMQDKEETEEDFSSISFSKGKKETEKKVRRREFHYFEIILRKE